MATRGSLFSLFRPPPLFASNLRQELQLAGLSERTQEAYLRSVRQLATHFGRPPDQVTEPELRQYLLFLKNEKHFAPASLKIAFYGIRFFFHTTAPRDWPTLRQLRIPGQAEQVDPAVWRRDWVVHSQAAGDGRASLRYLAAYVFRVAIGDHRIRSCKDGCVTFTWRRSGSRRPRSMTLGAEEFLRRALSSQPQRRSRPAGTERCFAAE